MKSNTSITTPTHRGTVQDSRLGTTVMRDAMEDMAILAIIDYSAYRRFVAGSAILVHPLFL